MKCCAETTDFDLIWVGTETRDYGDKRWGGTPQYEAYFIMRWLGGSAARNAAAAGMIPSVRPSGPTWSRPGRPC